MLNLRLLLLVLGLFLSKLTLLMLIPAAVAFYTQESSGFDFVKSAVITGIIATFFLGSGRGLSRRAPNQSMRARDMFLLTTLVWIFLSIFAALPLLLIHDISYTDAFFETMSGITTTGATVLSNLHHLPQSILLWRSILQWLGGIGFIVMGVGILPYLNVGGMKLFQTESSDWSEKQVPRIQTYAGQLFKVYTILTLLCAAGYYYAGMSLFDAINHSLTTVSTAGYSTEDSSMAAFPIAAHWVGMVFMFLGGLPFLLYIQMMQQRRLKVWRDEQVMGFCVVLLLAGGMATAYLMHTKELALLDATRLGFFNVIAIVTTTGYALTDYSAWGTFSVALFFMLSFIGGCSGSTSGGMKVFRFQVSLAVTVQHLKRMVHPAGFFTAKFNGRKISEDITLSVMTLVYLFLMSIIALALFLASYDLDFITSLSGAVAAVCNVGPALGDIIGPAGNYASLPDPTKWALCVGMLAGRLEITTMVILLFPRFWQK